MKSKLLKSLLLLMVLAIGIQLQAQTQSPQKALSFDGVNDYVQFLANCRTGCMGFASEQLTISLYQPADYDDFEII